MSDCLFRYNFPANMSRNRDSRYEEVQKAARFLPRLSSSARCLDDFHKQLAAIIGLRHAMAATNDAPAVLRSLLVFSQLPQQLCECLKLALQLLAARTTTAMISPEEAALAAVGQLAGIVALLPGAPVGEGSKANFVDSSST